MEILDATMLVAVCDQSTGASTSRCSKMNVALIVADRSGAGFPLDLVRTGSLPGSSRDVK